MVNKIIHPGNLVPMPGFRARKDRAGMWTGSQKYHCKENELASLLPRQGSVHPKMDFMALDEVEFEIMQEGLVIVTGHYAGASFGGGAGGVPEDEFSLEISTSEEPIQTHFRYESETAEDIVEAVELATNPPLEDDGKSVAEIDQTGWSALKVELYDDVRKGIESYREPRVSWTRRWVSQSKPTGLNEIGKIGTPDGDPPAIAAGRNWLNMGMRSVQRGEIFENEVTWELSGRGGWLARYYA